jgi:hypothetical protein
MVRSPNPHRIELAVCPTASGEGLGWRGEKLAEQALVECALRHPADGVEGPEIVNSPSLIGQTAPRRDGLLRLVCFHPAQSVAGAAQLAPEGAWKRAYRKTG